MMLCAIILDHSAKISETDRRRADWVIENIIDDIDYDFSGYKRDSSPDANQFILSKRKS